MMWAALLLQLPAMLQPTFSPMLHPNVTHVLAVGTDAVTPTEVCRKAESPQNRHKNTHLISSTSAWSNTVGPAVISPCNSALCRSIMYWLVDYFTRFAILDWTKHQRTITKSCLLNISSYLHLFVLMTIKQSSIYINPVLECIFSQFLFMSLVLLFLTPPLPPLGLSFISGLSGLMGGQWVMPLGSICYPANGWPASIMTFSWRCISIHLQSFL